MSRFVVFHMLLPGRQAGGTMFFLPLPSSHLLFHFHFHLPYGADKPRSDSNLSLARVSRLQASSPLFPSTSPLTFAPPDVSSSELSFPSLPMKRAVPTLIPRRLAFIAHPTAKKKTGELQRPAIRVQLMGSREISPSHKDTQADGPA